MTVRSPVADIDLTPDEERDLCRALGGTAAQLPTTLAPFASAAIREYVDMITGQAMTSASDLRERRLVAILLALPAASFPSDDQISKWFNMTPQSARSLLRTTLACHRNRLRAVMVAAAKSFIAAANQPGGQGTEWEARFPNAVVVDMLNDDLANAAAVRSPIRRRPGTFGSYVVPDGSMTELRTLYP
nr:hypothetical protein [Brevundimonas diminuta]